MSKEGVSMKKVYWLSSLFVFALLGVFAFVMNSPIDEAYAQVVGQSGSDEIPLSESDLDSANGSLSVNNFPGTRPVYFSPSDNNGTATVIIIYNTASVSRTTYVQAYSSSGLLTVNAEVTLEPYERKFLISDLLVSSPPQSWQNNLLTDFADLSTIGVIFVPDGVFFDGYILFNPGGTIDPRADQGAIPLHFSTDPLTVFLPAINNP